MKNEKKGHKYLSQDRIKISHYERQSYPWNSGSFAMVSLSLFLFLHFVSFPTQTRRFLTKQTKSLSFIDLTTATFPQTKLDLMNGGCNN